SAFQFEVSIWKFALFKTHGLAQLASKEALQSNVIIIAARNEQDLPGEVKQWLRGWLDSRHGAGALVALLTCDPSRTSSASPAQWLGDLAQKTGVQFFSKILVPAQSSFLTLVRAIDERAHQQSSTLSAILHQNSARSAELFL